MPSLSAAEPTLTRSTGPGALRRVRDPLVLGATVAAATLALHVRDPHRSGSWGLCPFQTLTGLWCPACGGLRAVNDLTHGDLGAAASSNLLFVVSIPLLLLWWGRWTRDRWQGASGRELAHPYAVTAIVVSLLVVFAVLRNLPFGAWLAP